MTVQADLFWTWSETQIGVFLTYKIISIYRYLFWSDWGKTAKIERSELDGSNRVTIVKDNLVWPNGLTVDEETNRVVWADARTEVG